MNRFRVAASLFLCIALFTEQRLFPQAKERHFSSPLGFELTYSGEWTANLLGQMPLITSKDIDQSLLNDPQKRAIACTQKNFFSRHGDQPSNFVAGVLSAACVGQLPTLQSFALHTTSLVRSHYRLTSLETGEFSVGDQKFWVLRASGESRTATMGTITIEYVATVLPDGIAYWSVEAHGSAAKTDFEHARLHLQNGAETEFFPENIHLSSASLQSPPPQASTPGRIPVEPDYKASHHFNSGLGFSYEVPADLTILNSKTMDTAVKALASKQPMTGAEAQSVACSQTLLVAENQRETRIIDMVVHRQSCVAFPLKPENLSRIGSYSLGELGKRFTLSEVKTAQQAIGTHPAWIMQSAIIPKNPANPNRFLAMIILPITEGMTEAIIQAKTQDDLKSLMATRIKFEDGSEGEIVSAAALSNE